VGHFLIPGKELTLNILSPILSALHSKLQFLPATEIRYVPRAEFDIPFVDLYSEIAQLVGNNA
jgi:hypothetical protein